MNSLSSKNSVKSYKTAFSNSLGRVKDASTSSKIIGVILLILFLTIIIYFVYKIYSDISLKNSNEPILVNGTIVARDTKIIPGNLIKPSSDSKFGIEFTYGLWIYVNGWVYKNGMYKHVFHKGNQSANPLQAPGLWLYPNENKLAINMNTYHSVKESCDIGNIPIKKWFHITISCIGKNLDVYINGRLKRRCKLMGIPKLNVGDLYISAFDGFDGFISNLRYFNYAVPYFKIEQMINDGPSKKQCIDTGERPPYFANDVWFQSGYPDAINFP